MKTMSKAVGNIFLIISLLLLSSSARAVEKKPVEIKQNDKCPVCGMFVAGYKDWIARIIFNDGTYAAFDGPKDMFRYYLNLNRYNPKKKQSDILSVYVTEYYSTRTIEARQSFFVLGSDVFGPMGAELVPIESQDKAREFLKDHKGKKVLKFGEITLEDLK